MLNFSNQSRGKFICAFCEQKYSNTVLFLMFLLFIVFVECNENRKFHCYQILSFLISQSHLGPPQGLRVRFPCGGMKYLIFLFPRLANEAKRGVDNTQCFKSGERKCLNGNTRFPGFSAYPTLYSGYSEKPKQMFIYWPWRSQVRASNLYNY